jgi:anti-sigma regulatory factor (Ser/Thr protein kinase)
VSALDLPPTTDSVPLARRFARSALRESSFDVETVLLLVSEVVTNAVLHARSSIRLGVEDREEVVRVEVHDASPVPPRMHHFRLVSGTGRGLRMLDRLAQTWGVEPDSAGAGKVVWFEVGTVSESSWDSYADLLLAEGINGDV